VICIKAQYSVEFILIFAFSLLIIIPTISLLHSEYIKSKESLGESQAKQVLDEITARATKVYYSGAPSRTTVEVFFPRGIRDVQSANFNVTETGAKSQLVFNMAKGTSSSEVIAVFPFNINVSLRDGAGKKRILIKAEESDYINITEFI